MLVIVNYFLPTLFIAIVVMTSFCAIGCDSTDVKTIGSETTSMSQTTVKSAGAGETLGVAEPDSGTSVNLKPGATLEVVLVSNPSTGYHWVVTSIDTGSLKQVGEAVYKPDPETEGLIGAGGTDTFRFEAVSPGDATISMDYLSPDNKPSDTKFTITTNVKSTGS